MHQQCICWTRAVRGQADAKWATRCLHTKHLRHPSFWKRWRNPRRAAQDTVGPHGRWWQEQPKRRNERKKGAKEGGEEKRKEGEKRRRKERRGKRGWKGEE